MFCCLDVAYIFMFANLFI